MKISSEGLALIKSFEGCKLTAYKAVSTEKYYTIGYGHYGADVTKGMKITQAQADAYLVSDLAKFEAKVEKYNSKYNFNENQFSALVSFAYNVGSIDQLTANGTRTIAQISAKFTAYNKSGGKVLAGLTKRRKAEKALFDKGTVVAPVQPKVNKPMVASPTIKKGVRGIHAKYLQQDLNYVLGLNLATDGVVGNKTVEAIKQFQKKYGLTVDGLYGPASYNKMKALLG
ncbi:MAG: glycoside hydrolase family protein [Paludibacteraceae bacterium]|nr:glycoside hydrolase family protein [Paludibacteraceae bacterium]